MFARKVVEPYRPDPRYRMLLLLAVSLTALAALAGCERERAVKARRNLRPQRPRRPEPELQPGKPVLTDRRRNV